MKAAAEFGVFSRWLDAPPYAFGPAGSDGIVPAKDKESYWSIYSELVNACERAVSRHPDAQHLILRPKRFSRERGSRGHRPVDLWASICPAGSEVLGYIPQVYVIASDRGLELGFAASINEDDYFDPIVKARNRAIIPFINSKLPQETDPLSSQLDDLLSRQGGWHFNRKTRLLPGQAGFDQFSSLKQLLRYLKQTPETSGAGTVCRLFTSDQLPALDLDGALYEALENFAPLLARCAPSAWDTSVRSTQDAVSEIGDTIEFDPADASDGKKKILAEVARRQGQGAFRKKLLDAYDGQCAITSTAVADVLQAAHIRPYNGPRTNHVSNGLLLRADIHNLFDLKLITIEPIGSESFQVRVSPRLAGTPYGELEGTTPKLPQSAADRPNRSAIGSTSAHHSARAAIDSTGC